MPLLQIQSGKHRGKSLRLHDGVLIIGRGESADLKIASAEISREHCRVRVDGENVFVCDLGSANGTYVDGNVIAAVREAADSDGPISGETLLAVGSQLHIGPMEFQRVERGQAPKPKAADEPAKRRPKKKGKSSGKVSAAVLKKATDTGQTASEDDALAWLTEDVPNPASGESDTSIIPRNDLPSAGGTKPASKSEAKKDAKPEPRVFASVAEEAADIFRRHAAGER